MTKEEILKEVHRQVDEQWEEINEAICDMGSIDVYCFTLEFEIEKEKING